MGLEPRTLLSYKMPLCIYKGLSHEIKPSTVCQLIITVRIKFTSKGQNNTTKSAEVKNQMKETEEETDMTETFKVKY